MLGRLVHDDYLPREGNAVLALLPDWVQWCADRAALPATLAAPALEAARAEAANPVTDDQGPGDEDGDGATQEGAVMDFSVLADRDCLVAFAAVVLYSDRGVEAHEMGYDYGGIAHLTSPHRDGHGRADGAEPGRVRAGPAAAG
jgi:hypothetical protein